MGKKTEGLVIEASGNVAIVMPTSHLGCDALYCCQGSEITKINVEMKNTVGAKTGDSVIFEAKEINMLKAAFVVYVLPLILMFSGAGIGYWGGNRMEISPVMFSVLFGGISFLFSLWIVNKYERYVSGNTNMKPEIISVLQETFR